MGNLEMLTPCFSSSEPFDWIDAGGTSYADRTGNTVNIPSLIYMDFKWEATWHQNFANPYVYNLYNLYRTYNLTTLSFQRNTPDLIGIPPYKAVFHAEDSWINPPLLDNECLPVEVNGIPVTNSLTNPLNAVVTGPSKSPLGNKTTGLMT
ncbi:MAG: hypothetical protein NTU44_08965, partial [Bacteroidetes bacterium]|nr:hypothetical protein [Bacteroidota bacterium]